MQQEFQNHVQVRNELDISMKMEKIKLQIHLKNMKLY